MTGRCSTSPDMPSIPQLAITSRVRLTRALAHFLIHHSFKGTGRLRRYLGALLVPPAHGPVVVPTTLGFSICVNPYQDRGVERAIYCEGIYEAGTVHVLGKILRPGDCFVDVGANIGLISLAGALAVGSAGHVYAFEPVPSTYEMLERNIAFNAARNVHAYPIALGSRRERRVIYRKLEGNSGEASLIESHDASPAALVPVLTLDGFLKETGIPSVRAIKLDVEGWEAEVLMGARELIGSAEAPILIVEYIAAGHSSDKLYDFLSSVNQYKLFKLSKGKDSVSKLKPVHTQRNLPAHDNLFCFRPNHLSEVPTDLFADGAR
jgi:FkbM family methyltransferase